MVTTFSTAFIFSELDKRLDGFRFDHFHTGQYLPVAFSVKLTKGRERWCPLCRNAVFVFNWKDIDIGMMGLNFFLFTKKRQTINIKTNFFFLYLIRALVAKLNVMWYPGEIRSVFDEQFNLCFICGTLIDSDSCEQMETR